MMVGLSVNRSVGYEVVKVLNKFPKSRSAIFLNDNDNDNDNGRWVLQSPVSISFLGE